MKKDKHAKNWICDCPEGWIIPLKVKTCSICGALSPSQRQGISSSGRRKKFWDSLTEKQRKSIVKRLNRK